MVEEAAGVGDPQDPGLILRNSDGVLELIAKIIFVQKLYNGIAGLLLGEVSADIQSNRQKKNCHRDYIFFDH